MGLDVWFREDIARALTAAQVAGKEAIRMEAERMEAVTEAQQKEWAMYWRGYMGALRAIAAAFGIRIEE